MISAIAIPADDTQPIHTVDIDRADLDANRRLVGGYLETTFPQPSAASVASQTPGNCRTGSMWP